MNPDPLAADEARRLAAGEHPAGGIERGQEAGGTERERERSRSLARIAQVVAYVFGLIYGLIGLEIVLDLLGARQSSGFKRLLDAVTSPLLQPFRGLMPDPALGSMRLMLSYVAALVVYALLHLAFKGLLRLFAVRKTTI